MLVLLLACARCKEPALEGSVTALVGEEEKLRASGADGVLQDDECRTLCGGFAPALAEIARCTVAQSEGDEARDTQGLGVGAIYLLTCEGTFYCV